MQISTPEKAAIENQGAISKSTSEFAQHYYISPWLSGICYFLAKNIVLPVYLGNLEVTGTANIPRSGAVILAPTHRSRWDSLVVPYATGRLVSGRDLRFMSSANEMKGLQGWFIKRLGGFPVDTDRPSISTFRHSVEVLCNQEMLTIFPEGGIFRDTQVHPLKEGLARIALQAQSFLATGNVKIVPISVHYSQPFPSWGTNAYVDIGSPLEVTNYDLTSVKQSSKQLTVDLTNALRELYDYRVASSRS